MANEWSNKSLDALGRIVTGKTPPSTIVDAFGGNVPFVTPSDMDGTRIISDTARTLSASGQTAVKNTVIPKNAVMVSCIGSDMGKAALAGADCITNQQINSIVIDTDDSPLFVYYNLSTRKSEIRGAASGSAQPILNKSAFGRLEIELPPPEEQRAIAHILGTLDDKIELNGKENETLEAMARALFKAWFVDFEPVRAKMEGRWQRGQSLPGLPAHLYDLFPDRLVESELGEIPEGWRVFTFGDVAQQVKGAVNPGNLPREAFTHYSLPAFDSAKTPVTELGVEIKSNKTPVPDGAVLVSKLNPHIPRIWQVGKAGVNAVCSTEFIVWTPKVPANSAFLYCLASSVEFNSAMRQLVTGTSNSHQRVKPDQLNDIRVFAASEAAICECSKLLLALIEQVLQNRQQSRSLAQLRDTLLPKLVSGDLRIQDAEEFLKRANP